MKVSLSWLKDYIAINMDADRSGRCTDHGRDWKWIQFLIAMVILNSVVVGRVVEIGSPPKCRQVESLSGRYGRPNIIGGMWRTQCRTWHAGAPGKTRYCFSGRISTGKQRHPGNHAPMGCFAAMPSWASASTAAASWPLVRH